MPLLRPIRNSRGFLALLAASCLVVLHDARAQTYSKLNIKGRVQIEIPEDWVINDAEQRKMVRGESPSMQNPGQSSPCTSGSPVRPTG